MRCNVCGRESAGGSRFCPSCGAPLPPPSMSRLQPRLRGHPQPPGPGRRNLWIGLAIVAALVLLIAIAVALVVAALSGDEQVVESTTTTSSKPTSPTTPRQRPSTTSTAGATSTTSSTDPVVPGPPGDSTGEWVETGVPSVMTPAVGVALSDEVLAVQVQTGSEPRLRARLFATGETFELPVGSGDVGGVGVDGTTVVWWEGTYDDEVFSYVDQRIYAYALPDGPKIEVAGADDISGPDKNVGYPQIAGSRLTWVEGRPWEESPDEYWLMPILGTMLDSQGRPRGEPASLVPSAVTSIIGDSGWSYSLSPAHLAWEQAADVDGLGTGTYVLDLATNETLALGPDAWRPSIAEDTLVYWEGRLVALDLISGQRWRIDDHGDFPAAGPTFAAYFRASAGAEGGYEIVARGYSGAFEQVLSERTSAPPWLAAPIAVSSTRVAFLQDDAVRLFEWQAR